MAEDKDGVINSEVVKVTAPLKQPSEVKNVQYLIGKRRKVIVGKKTEQQIAWKEEGRWHIQDMLKLMCSRNGGHVFSDGGT